MQFLSGVNLLIFWIASILWDFLLNIVTIIIIVLLVAFSSIENYNPVHVFLILFLYNFAMIPVICILSLLFASQQKKTFLIFLNFIGGAYRIVNVQPLTVNATDK